MATLSNIAQYSLEVEDAEMLSTSPYVSQMAVKLPVFQASSAGKGCVRLLKTMLTSVCENNCTYCAFRLGRDVPRATHSPDSLAEQFMCLWRAGVLDGLFLSSGICGGGVRTQDQLIKTAEILRIKWAYYGYLHLKIMPDSEFGQVKRAMQLADRVSINLEAPVDRVLHSLAPNKKSVESLSKRLKWVEKIRTTEEPGAGWNGHWSSSTTQFVVGADSETDRELLQLGHSLHKELHVQRVFFSGFAPITNTPLEGNQPVVQNRILRLYQSDFLLRDYGFSLNDLPLSTEGSLEQNCDPKKWWAEQHYRQQPLEVNTAEYWQLLRLPGIGPKTARRLLQQRANTPLKDMGALRRAGVAIEKVSAYILVNGRQLPAQDSLLTDWTY